MSKQYGLILPGENKKAASPQKLKLLKPSIFDESSDSNEENSKLPQLKAMTAPIAPGLMERRLARREQEKALKEDPSVFQYDEIYDEMDYKREADKQILSKGPKKPKYIARLMECAERRKLENELRVERQVQKDREEEGEQFKDKEAFVTAAYRKKLEDMRQLEVQEKREEYLESIGDVTKQQDLDGFYRHLYEQKMGSNNVVKEVILTNTEVIIAAADDKELNIYTPIKSVKSQQQRAYRKRNFSDDEAKPEISKVHLQNNIDADSDFSIDSSSDENDESQPNPTTTLTLKQNVKIPQTEQEDVQLVKSEETKEKSNGENSLKQTITELNVSDTPKVKNNKLEIWEKRTVGQIFNDAQQRYYKRKLARSA